MSKADPKEQLTKRERLAVGVLNLCMGTLAVGVVAKGIDAFGGEAMLDVARTVGVPSAILAGAGLLLAKVVGWAASGRPSAVYERVTEAAQVPDVAPLYSRTESLTPSIAVSQVMLV